MKLPTLRPRTTAPGPAPGDPPPPPPSTVRRLLSPRFLLVMLVLLTVNVLLARTWGPQGPTVVAIPYNPTFLSQVIGDNVSSITSTGPTIQGIARTPVHAPSATDSSVNFTTELPSFVGTGLEALLVQHKVTINAESPLRTTSPLLTLLVTFGPAILLIGGFIWLSRRAAAAAGGGIFGMGKSKARLYDAERPGTTFADVAGIDEVNEELSEVVGFLKEPAKYQRLGGTVPKGVLLVGPPGTGKTLLARAVAGEAGVPFFSVAASEFVEMIVGVGASRVRDLFEKARAAAPAIIFIDELDAIGRARSSAMRLGGHDEQEQTLNQILTEMDGFNGREGVIVIAATNRADVLDAALLRPGRFDRRVMVQPPDRAGRTAILTIHTRGVPLADDVDLVSLGSQTPGLVGAELRNLVNEAALLAARRDRTAVRMADFGDALEKVLLGAARHIVLSESDRERTAYHESGHALLGLLLPGADPVRKVSIVPRGRALGVTVQSPVDDRQNYPEDYLMARIIGALGGRAAELLIYGVVTTGAESDLKQVTNIAREMVVRWGMSPRVGPLNLADDGEGGSLLAPQRLYSEATAQVIDAEIRRIVEECFERAGLLLRENRGPLEALTRALLREDTLGEHEILAITGIVPSPDRPAAAEPRPVVSVVG
ncbi:MAG TPA: ATP-dependent zinc metalloprotease FtsH [Candidatus Dormibacteraeota bacterium]